MDNYAMNSFIRQLAGLPPVKPRLFVSYHHGNDQFWYDEFSRTFSDGYDIFTDRSLRDPINSDNTEYVMRRIREDYISGSSVTVVLCGMATSKRKYVDWEVKATLDKEHALLGIGIPGNTSSIVPTRLALNVESGYAEWTFWPLTAESLSRAVEAAKEKAKITYNIRNSTPMMSRNLS